MNQVDQKFVQKLQNLVQEVLSDEARFVARNDQQFATLHNKFFSKAGEMPFASLQPLEKDSFKKYFYLNNNVGTPRQDVPFTDSAEDQAFFFDQFHNQVKACTFAFDRMDFLRPSFADDKAPAPIFNAAQATLLVRGLVYPMIFSIEQREIALVEKKKSANVTSEGDEKKDNPYDQLADKMLVQGQSGQFDVVLTYAQMEEIAGQEDQLRKQGLPPEKVVELLREFINKRFPDLNLYLTPDGKVVTFLAATGISASGNLNGKNAVKNPTDLPAPLAGGQSFTELLQEMKLRQGRKLQYNAIIASNGKLGFSTQTFQVGTATLSGLSVEIDQSGQGNNAVFFVTDQQGTTAKVVVDTAAYRDNGKPDYNFKMYEKPGVDSPISPKIKLGKDELPKLNTPLLVLYGQMQAPEGYAIVPGQQFPKPLATGKLPQIPGGPTGEGEDAFGPGMLPGLGTAFTPKPVVSVGITLYPGAPTATGYKSGAQLPGSKKVKPKISAISGASAGAPTAEGTIEAEGMSGQGEGVSPQPGVKSKKSSKAPSSVAPGTKGLPIGAIFAASTALPIIAAISGGLVNIILNSK